MSENGAPGNCSPSAVASLQGALNRGSLIAVDSVRKRVYVANQQNGSDPDVLDVIDYSTAPYTVTSYNLDNNAIYSGLVVDRASGFVFVSEGQSSGSNSSLYVFNPSNRTITKVVGSGGQSLPAVAIYSIPNPANAQFSTLVVVGQTPPQQGVSPIAVVDTSQIQATGGAVTLSTATPLPQQSAYNTIGAAALDPSTGLLYVLAYTSSGGSSTNVELLSYDPTKPVSPSEQVLAGLSNVSVTSNAPLLAFNSQTRTAYLLNTDGTTGYLDLYGIGAIAGAQNQIMQITGSTVGDQGTAMVLIHSVPSH